MGVRIFQNRRKKSRSGAERPRFIADLKGLRQPNFSHLQSHGWRRAPRAEPAPARGIALRRELMSHLAALFERETIIPALFALGHPAERGTGLDGPRWRVHRYIIVFVNPSTKLVV